MDTIPQRSHLAKFYRSILTAFEGSLIFPFNKPEYYQVLGLVLSISLLFTHSAIVKIVLVVSVLILDWYDGAAARKFGVATRAGWMSDVAIDRMSEAFIFIAEIANPLGKVFFFLFIINVFLSFHAIKSKTSYLLAIRFFYLVVLVASLL